MELKEHEQLDISAPAEEKPPVPEAEAAENTACNSADNGTDTAAATQKSKRKKLIIADVNEAMKTFDTRTVEAPKKRRFGWVSPVLLLAVIGLSIWMMLEIVKSGGAEMKSLGDVISGGDWKFALVLLSVLLVIMICDCLKYAVVLKTTTGRYHLRESVKVAFLGKFYDNVTPFAAGGQPMQIYYLHKKGFSGGISSAAILIKYFAQMFCWVFVSFIFMACNVGTLNILGDSAKKTLLIVAGWIGIGVNMLLPLTVILFAFLPKFARAVTSAVITLGSKIKIVKDKEKTMKKGERVISEYRSAFVIMAHHPFRFISLILLCLVDCLLTFSFPYFAMRTFSGLHGSDFSTLLAVTAINIYVTQSVAVIPTPGNTGAMEGVGALAFSVFITGSIQFWSMFLWRFGVYYIYLIIGLGITVFEIIRKIVRHQKDKKNNGL